MYLTCYNCKGRGKYVLSRIGLIFLFDLHKNYITGIFTSFVDVERKIISKVTQLMSSRARIRYLLKIIVQFLAWLTFCLLGLKTST